MTHKRNYARVQQDADIAVDLHAFTPLNTEMASGLIISCLAIITCITASRDSSEAACLDNPGKPRKYTLDKYYGCLDERVTPCVLPARKLILAAIEGRPLIPNLRALTEHEKVLLMFAHVPKTGGTTFAHILAAVCQTSDIISCTVQQRKELPGFAAINIPWPPSVDNQIKAAHLVHGHWVQFDEINSLSDAAKINATHIVKILMVRNPIQRMLSDYLQTAVPFEGWWFSNKNRLSSTTEQYVGDIVGLKSSQGEERKILVLLTERYMHSMRLLDAVFGLNGSTSSFERNYGGKSYRCFNGQPRTGMEAYQAWARRSTTGGLLNQACSSNVSESRGPLIEHHLETYATTPSLREEVLKVMSTEMELYRLLELEHCCQVLTFNIDSEDSDTYCRRMSDQCMSRRLSKPLH